MTVAEYQEYVKRSRAAFFDSPYDLVYRVFVDHGFASKDNGYFANNASHIVESLRQGCWNAYVPLEQDFITRMLTSLIDDSEIEGMSAKDAIVWFAETHPEHIYQLSLSNTQSRRSRAGKEFETIIELILMGAGVALDTQGNIGKKIFVDKGLGKLVDVVSPGVIEFAIDKNDVVLISAKTTLRERWQEVPEEMGRTGAKEMFLATLDENISDDVLETLYESNIRITTTKRIKEACYPNNKRVLDFERLIDICLQSKRLWDSYAYKPDETAQIISTLRLQTDKHRDHDFVYKRYLQRINQFLNK